MAHQLDAPLTQLKPIFPPSRGVGSKTESPAVQQTIDLLGLQPHIEGGYFVETDRDPLNIANPFLATQDPGTSYAVPAADVTMNTRLAPGQDHATRSASTTIYYYITPGSPLGCFHRNRGRTVHTLHRGRGRYVLIHADEVLRRDRATQGNKARIETFVVGHDIAQGERLQWIVEGGKFKASFLLPDAESSGVHSEGLLISEVCPPKYL
jgi:predicted cupin superfamily sugar epimerase